MKLKKLFAFCLVMAIMSITVQTTSAKKKADTKQAKDTLSGILSGMKWRSIGPAWASGRIADFAVNPNNFSEYYVAVASGNIWKTVNHGITWKPVFDNYGSYSIGCLKLDPNNSNVLWVGTGENNHQRALGYGDGVYKSVDGGESFTNMGLKNSRQIGGIVIDPRNSDIVFVAAEGSAWGSGGDRGLYKTTDGGKNWKKVLNISENTGVNNVVIDPVNPNVMYATSEQRRRHVFTKIGGGPETSVYKSVDGGDTWYKINKGLPGVDKGGMGIAVSPVNHNVVYLIVEAAQGKGGFYRSTNQGESWKKMSGHSSSGQYFNEIYCDPQNVDKVYSLETYSFYTMDGGKTWERLSNNNRHVDDHALWINPKDPKNFKIGCDGGMYETYDGGKNYDFFENLPVTQFYRVAVDYQKPFYYVYGGTQDNNSMGGPSRTTCRRGIKNDDWFVTVGGDGFFAAVDPKDANIVYTEYQYGNMYRYDKKSGEKVFIKPQEGENDLAYKWNWNAPLLVSQFDHKTIYCAANKLFESNDRGNTWKAISPDLTAQIDRNTWKVMGKYWSSEADAKDVSTSQFGTIVSVCESPIKKGLLYVGTDDGVIQITDNDGQTWTKVSSFPGVPAYTYVSDICADKFDENTVYATFDNTKRDDFKPYLLKSTDKGKTWKPIGSGLDKNGALHTVEQDFVKKDLMFAGTEFGMYVSFDQGNKWTKFKSGLPTIPVMDIAIQKEQNDLAIATFGRGFYIMDDYSALRNINSALLKDAEIFPVRDAKLYVQTGGKSNQGSTYYFAKNPKFGATFTYYLKNAPKSRKQIRRDKEAKLFKNGDKIPQVSMRDLELENLDETAHLIFTIKDANGDVVRRINKKPTKGVSRVTWDLRYTAHYPITKGKFNPLKTGGQGELVFPGKYTVELALWNNHKVTKLSDPVAFNVVPLNNATLPSTNRAEMVAFMQKTAKLYGTVMGTDKLIGELQKKIEDIKQAIYNSPKGTEELAEQARSVATRLENLHFTMHGVTPKASWEEIPPAKIPLVVRMDNLMWSHYASTSDVTNTAKQQFDIVSKQIPVIIKKVAEIVKQDIPKLEEKLDEIGAPWTPDRIPVLK